MREWTVASEGDGKRLDKYLAARLPGVSVSLLQKSLRLGRVKKNGKRVKADERIAAGDVLQLYLNDEWFSEAPRKKADPLLSSFRHHLRILYEDDAVLLVDKRPGMIVHPDAQEKVNTLVTHVRAYLYQKGAYEPDGGFSPAPCNRIDRFTGSVVIVAKTPGALKAIDHLVRERGLQKCYLCIARGALRPAEGMLDNFILKGEKRVKVLDRPAPGAQTAQTRYRTLAQKNGMSLVECELITGRTHQIRAQMAHFGHPLLGDGQYGDAAWNRSLGRGAQALYAYKVRFPEGLQGEIAQLSGRTFAVRDVPFARELFADTNWKEEI